MQIKIWNFSFRKNFEHLNPIYIISRAKIELESRKCPLSFCEKSAIWIFIFNRYGKSLAMDHYIPRSECLFERWSRQIVLETVSLNGIIKLSKERTRSGEELSKHNCSVERSARLASNVSSFSFNQQKTSFLHSFVSLMLPSFVRFKLF